jgi:short-subunit dehydrogenase
MTLRPGGLPLLLLALAVSGCATGGHLGSQEAQQVSRRTYVLVGASSGFGRGVALKLAANGANVVLAARRADLLEDIARQAQAQGAQSLVVPMDVSKPQDVQRLSQAAQARFGHVDAWINFAGIGTIGRFWDIPIEDHARMVDINLTGVIYASHAALQIFKAQGSGVLVNLGSIDSEVPLAYQASYSSTKAAIRSLDQAVNEELRLSGLKGVHVVTIEPWATDTPWWRHAANYSGGTPRMAMMDGPDKVVDAIVWSTLHPQAELPVGWKAQMSYFAHHLAPHTTEHLTANVAHRKQIETAPPAPPTHGSLFQPDPGGRGVDDGVRDRMRREDAERAGRAAP